MHQRTRREFLTDVGRGMVVASVGSSLAADLGFGAAFAQQGTDRLTFGRLEPLVTLMQETAPDRLIPQVVERLRQGTELREIVAAAALANARTFGGEDYVGFHTMMAIAPCYYMAGEMPAERRALPVLKVLYRNANRIQEQGGPRNEVLRPVEAAAGGERSSGTQLRDTVRGRNVQDAERAFASLARGGAEDALNSILPTVQDGYDVHRVVLPYRAFDLAGIIGQEQAHTLLRQSVRFCVKQETPRYLTYVGDLRTYIPRLLDQHRLEGRELGRRTAEDGWVDELSRTIFRGTPEQAADAAAAALAEGFDPAAIGEAICLAANQLVLRDNGRTTREVQPNKPLGSVHGDSIGVHACDSANAWRNLSRAGNPRNKVVCLLIGAWQVARDRTDRGGEFLTWQPYPRDDARTQVQDLQTAAMLPALEEAIRGNDQPRAAAVAQRYLDSNQPARGLFDVLLRYAISEDGALHAEKFYRTVTEEYANSRPAFRNRQLVALARVTASAHGFAAPGHTEACRLLAL